MTRDEAIAMAREFVKNAGDELDSISDVRYLDSNWFDENEAICPPDLRETFQSVRGKFRNHWVVEFNIPADPGISISPSNQMVCVYDDGSVSFF